MARHSPSGQARCVEQRLHAWNRIARMCRNGTASGPGRTAGRLCSCSCSSGRTSCPRRPAHVVAAVLHGERPPPRRNASSLHSHGPTITKGEGRHLLGFLHLRLRGGLRAVLVRFGCHGCADRAAKLALRAKRMGTAPSVLFENCNADRYHCPRPGMHGRPAKPKVGHHCFFDKSARKAAYWYKSDQHDYSLPTRNPIGTVLLPAQSLIASSSFLLGSASRSSADRSCAVCVRARPTPPSISRGTSLRLSCAAVPALLAPPASQRRSCRAGTQPFGPRSTRSPSSSGAARSALSVRLHRANPVCLSHHFSLLAACQPRHPQRACMRLDSAGHFALVAGSALRRPQSSLCASCIRICSCLA